MNSCAGIMILSMPKETQAQKIQRVRVIIKALKKAYPDARCALNYSSAWELLVATILSAQCTDKRVNLVTPALFKKYPKLSDYAQAELSELEMLIHSTGFYKNKARNIRDAAALILSLHEEIVPRTMEELIQIPGVGRKTANVVLGNFYGIAGLTVDTHMIRVNRRLGFSNSDDAVKVEFELMKLIEESDWVLYTHLIIKHGRKRCVARRPDCRGCEIRSLCPKICVKMISAASF